MGRYLNQHETSFVLWAIMCMSYCLEEAVIRPTWIFVPGGNYIQKMTKATRNHSLFHQVINYHSIPNHDWNPNSVPSGCTLSSTVFFFSQEQSVKVVTMFPLRWVTVLQCCFPEPWNLLSVLELCELKENIFSKSSNMSSKSPPPKPPCWNCLLCLFIVSRWAWKWLSKCLFWWAWFWEWEWKWCWCRCCWPNSSKSLKMSSKLKLNDWKCWLKL